MKKELANFAAKNSQSHTVTSSTMTGRNCRYRLTASRARREFIKRHTASAVIKKSNIPTRTNSGMNPTTDSFPATARTARIKHTLSLHAKTAERASTIHTVSCRTTMTRDLNRRKGAKHAVNSKSGIFEILSQYDKCSHSQ